jgi:F-type H+-transporting ATPase subunit gamma
MASLKALKLRIGSVKSTQKITKALNMVAAAKLRRAQQNAEAGRPYSTRMAEVVASLARASRRPAEPQAARRHRQGRHPPDRRRHRRPRPCRRVQHQHRPRRAPQGRRAEAEGKTVLFYIVGRKGRPVIQRFYPKAIIAQHDTSEMKAPAMPTRRRSPRTSSTASRPTAVRRRPPRLRNFRSTLVQEPTVDQIIPVRRRAPTTAPRAPPRAAVEYEPDEEEILAELLPRNIAVQIYRALLENQAGFYGSQMTAMDNATRNAGDMINKLSIQYNRQRQAAITTELVEIISGAEAL